MTLQVGAYHPVKFGGQKHSDGGDILVLVCHVILQDHVIKGLRDFMGTLWHAQEPIKVSYHPAKLVAIRIEVVEI